MSFSPLVDQLVESLRCLPGVGPKSAQRMALQLLEKNRDQARYLAETIQEATEKVGNCQSCRTLSEDDLCRICRNEQRDQHTLCIVETPMDMMAIEQSSLYHGRYFVLKGRLSPLDGIGPEELKLNELEAKLKTGEITEVILAVNPSVEGEATSNYLVQMIKQAGLNVSKIAYGVPYGGELEFVDSYTLSHAFGSRQLV